MAKDFEIVPHTADLKIRAYGSSLQELFQHALQGMFQCMRPVATECHYRNERLLCPTLTVVRPVGVNSPDVNALLVDFLSYALYLSDVHNEAYLNVAISSLTSTAIIAQLQGVPITGFQESEIKAVTYHDLNVVQKEGLWQTEIVFDI